MTGERRIIHTVQVWVASGAIATVAFMLGYFLGMANADELDRVSKAPRGQGRPNMSSAAWVNVGKELPETALETRSDVQNEQPEIPSEQNADTRKKRRIVIRDGNDLIGEVNCYRDRHGGHIPDGWGLIYTAGKPKYRVLFRDDQMVEAAFWSTPGVGEPIRLEPFRGAKRLEILSFFLGAPLLRGDTSLDVVDLDESQAFPTGIGKYTPGE